MSPMNQEGQSCPMRDQGAVAARRRGSRRRWMRALPALSVAMLGCDQVADQLDELLLAASRRGLRTVVSSLRDIGGVFAVHDEERHALDVVALSELLGALQVRAHGERVVGLGEVVGTDAVLGRELLLHAEGLVVAAEIGRAS